MFLFKLGTLFVLLLITLYTANKYARLCKRHSMMYYGIYITFITLQIIFVLRFVHLSIIETTSWLMQTVLFTTGIYLALIIFSFLFFILGDILHFIYRKQRRTFSIFQAKRYMFLCVCISIIVSIYGNIHAKQIKVTTYTYQIEKQSKQDALNIIYISDLHLGNSIHHDELKNIVDKVNSIHPDIILYGGDIFDENTSKQQLQSSIPYFKQMKATYGSYYIYGNHEFYSESQSRYNNILKQSNIHILEDESITIENAFTIVGRLDIRKHKNRKSLSTLLKDIDGSKPIIVLDHQPIVDEHDAIDLQLSGHTHNGQIFPANFIVPLVYKNGYGFDKEPYPLITSSGAGTWGIPMRIGSNAEIVNIKLTFK
ncbi:MULTISPECIES: metallophosphoesterase [unclassified Breznakia]|uniref:metallophosphoesterase n=1 Tax=unclassified Breznakia TaxID=2623764 RepID=UPI0024051FFF|nr:MULTISPECIES: metallophosphoesterase [unclassified Breznakia]MDF9837424.1 putative MPP superfamily phosphohydrolase [Breznakia sp. PFB2-8]MDF9859360.1 putative MPP superfamily phosphohydrolase [Breznakia sp. PH5-24]